MYSYFERRKSNNESVEEDARKNECSKSKKLDKPAARHFEQESSKSETVSASSLVSCKIYKILFDLKSWILRMNF